MDTQKRAARRQLSSLAQSKMFLADIERLHKPESEPAFGCKADLSFAARVGRAGAGSRSNQRPNSRAFAAASQRSNQSASARASSNEGQISLLVGSAAYKHAVGLQGQSSTIHCDR